MATIRTAIELQDNFSGILNSIVGAVHASVSAVETMQAAMSGPVDTAALAGIREYADQAAAGVQELAAALQNVEPPAPPDPPEWQGDTFDVFTGTGAERFEQEVQSANVMLDTLRGTQAQIAAQAAQTSIFPPGMAADLDGMQARLQAVQQRILAIEGNPLNMGTDTANAELEQLRGQLDQAVQAQERLNDAVQGMDVSAANAAYLQLSQTIGNTERYLRDNVSEQGRFNREIRQGADGAGQLKGMLSGALGAFAGVAGIKKAFSFVGDCMQAFDTQLNAETQLVRVLANTMNQEMTSGAAQLVPDVTADTAGVAAALGAAGDGMEEIAVPVTAETGALTAAFDQITEKAAEIQSRGIYGDETMIAAAAEFATYFSDTDAIGVMMDTLADYAIGMENGVSEVSADTMVNYATNLGKIMAGSYDAMSLKGFEFSDAQKAIIEGTAAQEQIVSTLGEEYLSMSQDMQAAAVISQVIEESWAGLYETMSNTPEGKIMQMTNAFGDMKEVIGGQLYPFVLLFVDAVNANWPTIEGVVQGITFALEMLLGALSWCLDGGIAFAQGIQENWSWISPMIYGMIGALAVYAAYLAITKGIEAASAAAKIILCAASYAHAAATGAEVSSTATATAAQYGLNTALLACPLTWIIVLIIALVALFYAAVAAVNHFAGTSVSATGIICGAFLMAAAFIGNLLLTLFNFAIDLGLTGWNFIAAFANFFANVFKDPVGSIARLFFDLADCVLGILESLASAIDTVFGSNLAGAVAGWRGSLGGWVDATFGQGEEIMQKMDASSWHLDRFEYGDAWNAGDSFGRGIEEGIANFDPASLFGAAEIPAPEDFAASLTDGGIGGSVDDIAGNTGAIRDAMDITQEDLKYLRDLAEQEAINRFTTAEINIEQTNHNNVSGGMDLDGIIDGLTGAVTEAVGIITEGVHA